MKDKVVVVTGANGGLGFELSRKLARGGAHVVMACRSQQRGQRAYEQLLHEVPRAQLTMLPLDVSEQASIRHFGAIFRERVGSLDVLINNAGIAFQPLSRNSAGVESQLATNYLGPFSLVGTLLSAFRPEARIVNVSSLAHRLGRLDLAKLNPSARDYGKFTAYAGSKLALLCYTAELSRRLRESGKSIVALAAHPGFAATDIATHAYGEGLASSIIGWLVQRMTRSFPVVDAAEPILDAAFAPGLEGGTYYGPGGWFEIRGARPRSARQHALVADAELASRLWTETERLTDVRYLSGDAAQSGRGHLAVDA